MINIARGATRLTCDATADDDEVKDALGLGVEAGIGGSRAGVGDGAVAAQHQVHERHEERDVGCSGSGAHPARVGEMGRVREVTFTRT